MLGSTFQTPQTWFLASSKKLIVITFTSQTRLLTFNKKLINYSFHVPVVISCFSTGLQTHYIASGIGFGVLVICCAFDFGLFSTWFC